MNNVAISGSSTQLSPFWQRLIAAMAQVTHRLAAAPSSERHYRALDDRLICDMGMASVADRPAAPGGSAPRLAAPRPGRPVCRWRMSRSGAGLAMDWIDPKGEVVAFARSEAAATMQEPARAAFG